MFSYTTPIVTVLDTAAIASAVRVENADAPPLTVTRPPLRSDTTSANVAKQRDWPVSTFVQQCSAPAACAGDTGANRNVTPAAIAVRVLSLFFMIFPLTGRRGGAPPASHVREGRDRRSRSPWRC